MALGGAGTDGVAVVGNNDRTLGAPIAAGSIRDVPSCSCPTNSTPTHRVDANSSRRRILNDSMAVNACDRVFSSLATYQCRISMYPCLSVRKLCPTCAWSFEADAANDRDLLPIEIQQSLLQNSILS